MGAQYKSAHQFRHVLVGRALEGPSLEQSISGEASKQARTQWTLWQPLPWRKGLSPLPCALGPAVC